MSIRDIVLVGGGQASAVATRTLRRRGYEGTITLVGDESVRPYQRPPLSKEYLVAGDEDALYLLPESWTQEHEVDVRSGVRALKISAGDGSVLLEDGSSLRADRVLLATGGRPRRLKNADGERIVHLRNKADADRLRQSLTPGCRLVVVGAGFIGAEIASSARELGADVTVLEAAATPMERALGPTIGASCARLQRRAGVDLRLGVQVQGVTEHRDEVVVSTDQGPVAGDVVVIGIGIEPNVEVADGSGITVDNGIVVDQFCRTSMPGVYAAGDVANHFHPLYGTHLRVEHFDHASKQGAAAANNMIGRETVYADPHWCWSDQFGANLQLTGRVDVTVDPLVRGSVDEESWTAFFVQDGRLRAAFAVNAGADVMVARELIAAGVPVDPRQLVDPDVSLIDLLEQM